jgi:hypothetical protein
MVITEASEAPDLEDPTNELVRICRSALVSGDSYALTELRERAKEIRARLQDGDIRDALTIELGDDDVSDERVAAVYEILAEAEPSAALLVDTREHLLTASLDQETQIGEAFGLLLKDLDRQLKHLTLVFARVPSVSEVEQRRLRQTPSVMVAWPASAPLIACGLTPLYVLNATTTVHSLATRLKRAKLIKADDSIMLSYIRRSGTSPPRHAIEFSKNVAREVRQIAHCSEIAANVLVDWLIDVACDKPFVFAGTEAKPKKWGIELAEVYSDEDLCERWQKKRKASARSTSKAGVKLNSKKASVRQ